MVRGETFALRIREPTVDGLMEGMLMVSSLVEGVIMVSIPTMFTQMREIHNES